MELIGCSVPEFLLWMEKQFLPALYWFSVNLKKLGWQLMSECCFGYV
jgi:hypothetical protein